MEEFAIARPYVKAILTIAADDCSYAEWEKMLNFLSMVVTDVDGSFFLRDMSVSTDQKIDFLSNINPKMLNKYGVNFIKTLAGAKRLMLLPSIFSLYEILMRKAESKLDIYLQVAQKSEIDVGAEFSSSIKGDEINITEEIAPNLIAGGVARMGNIVVDGSYKGQLASLREFIVSE